MSSIHPLNTKGFAILNGENYIRWLEDVNVLLAGAGLRKVVSDDFKPDTQGDYVDDGKAWALLVQSVEPGLRAYFSESRTALGFIAKARSLYGSQDPIRYQETLHQLSELRFTCGQVDEHIIKVGSMISSMKLYTTDPISSFQEARLLVNTLGREHDLLKVRVNAGELVTWDAVVKHLRASHHVLTSKSTNVKADVTPRPAFAVSTFNSEKTLSYKEKQELIVELVGRGYPVCHICSQVGHFSEGHKQPARSSKITFESKTSSADSSKKVPKPAQNVAASVLSSAPQTHSVIPVSPVDQLNQALDMQF